MFGMVEVFERIYCDTCLGKRRYLRGVTVIMFRMAEISERIYCDNV